MKAGKEGHHFRHKCSNFFIFNHFHTPIYRLLGLSAELSVKMPLYPMLKMIGMTMDHYHFEEGQISVD